MMCSRITPACAGNSYARVHGLIEHGDHPRVCGEQPIPYLSLIHI